MATYVWCELVCDCCANTSRGRWITDNRVPRKELKAQAVGWIFTGDLAFCCNTCKKSFEESPLNQSK